MITFKMKKLVRDKIPQIIKGQGGIITRKILNTEEFFKELKEKLVEEAKELGEVELKNKEELTNELADVKLLMDYLMRIAKIENKELLEVIKSKSNKVGDFKKRIYIETVKLPDNSDWVGYYRKKKFEEI